MASDVAVRTVERLSGAMLRIAEDALRAAGDVAYIWNLQDDSIDWVGDAASLFGTRDAETIGNGELFNERVNIEDLSRRLEALSRHLQRLDLYDCEYRLRRDDGDFVWVHDKAAAELGEDGIPLRISGVLRLVTHRKQQESMLEHKANYDELTGHLNRSRLREALQTVLAYTSRYDSSGAYLALGIDKLSMLNDAYGHKTADAVIVGAGQLIERCLRVTDHIGRIGGDRFGVVLSNCSDAGILTTAEKILQTFRNSPIDTPSGPVRVTVSIGGLIVPGVAQTAQDAMTAAESALQSAKARGRNCFVECELSEEERSVRRNNIEVGERVVNALEDDRIVFAYQPVVDGRSLDVVHYETLLRMVDAEGRIAPAGLFVPVAEKLGLIRQLDRRALEIAVQDLRDHPHITLALNISSLTVTDQSWLRALVSATRSDPSVAGRLIVEITETAALEDFDMSARFVSAVRNLGCKVALDDFGSGYTSFRQLKALTVDVVKIDGAFIKDVGQSPDNQIFVRTLLDLARGFGLKTVAECVETAEEARILRSEGADFLQGWHFGKPETRPAWRRN